MTEHAISCKGVFELLGISRRDLVQFMKTSTFLQDNPDIDIDALIASPREFKRGKLFPDIMCRILTAVECNDTKTRDSIIWSIKNGTGIPASVIPSKRVRRAPERFTKQKFTKGCGAVKSIGLDYTDMTNAGNEDLGAPDEDLSDLDSFIVDDEDSDSSEEDVSSKRKRSFVDVLLPIEEPKSPEIEANSTASLPPAAPKKKRGRPPLRPRIQSVAPTVSVSPEVFWRQEMREFQQLLEDSERSMKQCVQIVNEEKNAYATFNAELVQSLNTEFRTMKDLSVLYGIIHEMCSLPVMQGLHDTVQSVVTSAQKNN